jgi:hypothetical protein
MEITRRAFQSAAQQDLRAAKWGICDSKIGDTSDAPHIAAL